MACCPGPILAWQWWHADILILGVQSSIWRIPHTFFPLVQKKSSLLQKVTQNPQTAFPENEHFTCAQRQINANQPQDLTIKSKCYRKTNEVHASISLWFGFQGGVYLRGCRSYVGVWRHTYAVKKASHYPSWPFLKSCVIRPTWRKRRSPVAHSMSLQVAVAEEIFRTIGQEAP